MFDQKKADRAIRFFELLKHTDGQFYNQPFILLDWERKIIRDVYGTVKEDGTRQYKYVYIEIPKKNGKSELGAGAALYHIFADWERNGEVYSCAADRGQASIVYKVAHDMIDLVPALKRRARVTDSQKTIKDKKYKTAYKVLSADAFTKHGFKPSAVIFDELHAQPSRDLWDVMTFESGASRKQPIWWVLTTAGDDPDRVSIGWEIHEYAVKVASGKVIDPSWYVCIFHYEGDDIYNEDNWRSANPSLGFTKSLDSMREAARTAQNKPANERLFRWLDLNQWITTKLSTWQPLELFDNTVGNWDRSELLGKSCYLGLDLSSTTDLSALAVIFPPQDGIPDWRVFWDAWIPAENMQERIKNDHVPYDIWAAGKWIVATPGDIIDYTEIERAILDIAKYHRIIELAADRAMATMLLQRLEQAGIVCVDVPQTFVGLSDAMNIIEVLLKGRIPEEEQPGLVEGSLLSGRMTHEGNPVARWCFGNTAIAKNGQGYIKFVKEHKGKSVDRTKRIDLVAAWVDAMVRARYHQSGKSIYETRPMIVL